MRIERLAQSLAEVLQHSVDDPSSARPPPGVDESFLANDEIPDSAAVRGWIEEGVDEVRTCTVPTCTPAAQRAPFKLALLVIRGRAQLAYDDVLTSISLLHSHALPCCAPRAAVP